MNVLITAVFLVTLASPQAATPAQAGKLDFSGVETFWKIADILHRDQEPSQVQWDDLFSTPGYAALEAREKKRAVLTKAMRLALMPSQKEALEEALKANNFLARSARHLAQVPAHREELDEAMARIRKSHLRSAAKKRDLLLISKDVIQAHEPPDIAFVFFAPDGRGYQNLIVVDLLEATSVCNLEGFMAHEFFHFYFGKMPRKQYQVTESSEPLMDAFVVVQEEGTADLMDKREVPQMTETQMRNCYHSDQVLESMTTYRRQVLDPQSSISKANEILEELATHPENAKDLGLRMQRELPDNGRPLGAHMARTIIRYLGEGRMRETLTDTFVFWRDYQEAARRSRGTAPLFSADAMKAMNEFAAKSCCSIASEK